MNLSGRERSRLELQTKVGEDFTITEKAMERLYMEVQVGLKTTALTLFLNLFFHFLPAAALCDDFSLVDSVET